jgi:hypothetical protein
MAYDLYMQTVSCLYLSCPIECLYAKSNCFDCEQTNCQAAKDACVSSELCLGYWYCLDLCSAPACYDQCEFYWAAGGGGLYDAYATCSVDNCTGACG